MTTTDGTADPRALYLARIFHLLRWAAALAVVAIAVWLLSDVLVVLFAATLLAVILHGCARLVRRATRLPEWAALLVVVLVILAALAGLGYEAGPGLARQATALRDALVNQAGTLHERLSGSSWGRIVLNQVPASLGGNKQGGGGGVPAGLAGSVVNVITSVFGLFGTLVVVLIAGLYLAAAPATYANGVLRLVPPRHRALARTLAEAAGGALWAWSAGQALDMLVVGLLSGLGLWAIGVPLAMVLGVLAGLFNFVPYIGAIIGAVPAVIIAFSTGTSHGFETVGLYCVIQAFEGNVMAPMIQKRAVDLPPALTILSQTAFGGILGIAGLIFATPLTAALLAAFARATTPVTDAEWITTGD